MEIKYYLKLSSTNFEAKKLAKTGATAWTVIVAERQLSGYGKNKRFWFSPKGGLYFSVILPKFTLANLQILTFATGIAVVKVLRENLKIKATLKWPNDVLIFAPKSQGDFGGHKNYKKVAGILVENIIGKDVKVSIVGVGLNTNIGKFPKELAKIATSIKKETKREVDNKKILILILKKLKRILKMNDEKIMKEYRKYESTLGRKIEVLMRGRKLSAKALDFDRKGNLLVKLEKGGLIKILEGDLKYEF